MARTIHVCRGIDLREYELQEAFVRASGPGGQNVNKVATAVQLRFDVAHSPSLTPTIRARLIKLGGRRVSKDGVLIIEAKSFRTRERNRQDAVDRLVDLIRQATHTPIPRIKTKPSMASRRRRLQSKRHRGDTKRLRRSVSSHD